MNTVETMCISVWPPWVNFTESPTSPGVHLQSVAGLTQYRCTNNMHVQLPIPTSSMLYSVLVHKWKLFRRILMAHKFQRKVFFSFFCFVRQRNDKTRCNNDMWTIPLWYRHTATRSHRSTIDFLLIQSPPLKSHKCTPRPADQATN